MTDWEQLRLDGRPEPLARWSVTLDRDPLPGALGRRRWRWVARRGDRIRRGRWWPTASHAALAAFRLGAELVVGPEPEETEHDPTD